MHKLYYGDNLPVLRNEIADESVDLIYLDPPFNSKANYNVLFKSPMSGTKSEAQIRAFRDFWHWDEEAEWAYGEVIARGDADVVQMLRAMREFLRDSDLMAYLTMMAVRLLELRRVLKPTGSIYLHCDQTAGHYIKILLDAIFGGRNFANEIIWHYKTGGANPHRHFSKKHDIIFSYGKPGGVRKFNMLREKSYNRGYKPYRFAGVTEFRDENCPVCNVSLPKNLGWYTTPGMRDVWVMDSVGRTSHERLGYDTQKPLALLERIVQASSNPGDVVLDPFCGCGTTIHAAQKLKRKWIGIDVTHLAVALVESRLKSAFPKIKYEVHGTPTDMEGARNLAARDKYQFQWWALSLIGARPYGEKKKGADAGIDGVIYFWSDKKKASAAIVSVKGGENVGVGMVRDLKGVMSRENAPFAILITLAEPTAPMRKEAAEAGFHEHGGRSERFPKVQILTIAELFSGIRPRIPAVAHELTYKQAARENDNGEQIELG